MEQKLQQWKRWEKQHHKMLIIGAAVIFVIAAFVFFALNGKSGTISESAAGESISAGQKSGDSSQVGDASGEPQSSEGPSRVYVDIAGAVKKPGVYEVDASARMFEVVEEAGGLTKDADTALMNLAERVSDGMKIVIPAKGTPVSNPSDQYQTPDGSGGSSRGSGKNGNTQGTAGSGSHNSNLVNINQADVIELQTINGIGPVTAEAVVAYREEHGLFRTKEDLKKVRGIGDKTFEKLKDQITL